MHTSAVFINECGIICKIYQYSIQFRSDINTKRVKSQYLLKIVMAYIKYPYKATETIY